MFRSECGQHVEVGSRSGEVRHDFARGGVPQRSANSRPPERTSYSSSYSERPSRSHYGSYGHTIPRTDYTTGDFSFSHGRRYSTHLPVSPPVFGSHSRSSVIYSDQGCYRSKSYTCVEGINFVGYIPFIGTIVGVCRIWFGMSEFFVGLIALIVNPEWGSKVMVHGMGQVLRGSIEIIPFLGGGILFIYDRRSH